MSDWFLHTRDANTFHFRLNKTPESTHCLFSVTYIYPGYGFMSGDMGCLCWSRHEAMDYGFPRENTGIDYFAEKVRLANDHQLVKTWDCEKAKEDIINHFIEKVNELELSPEEIQEYENIYADNKEVIYADIKEVPNEISDLIEMREMLQWVDWDNYNPEIGRFKMVEDLNEHFPYYSEWYEYGFGDKYDEWFVRRYNVLKSVSNIILDVVRV